MRAPACEQATSMDARPAVLSCHVHGTVPARRGSEPPISYVDIAPSVIAAHESAIELIYLAFLGGWVAVPRIADDEPLDRLALDVGEVSLYDRIDGSTPVRDLATALVGEGLMPRMLVLRTLADFVRAGLVTV
jgi:hypothetical protein